MTTNDVAELYREVERMRLTHAGEFPAMLRFVESFLRFGEEESRQGRHKQWPGGLKDDPCLREKQVPG